MRGLLASQLRKMALDLVSGLDVLEVELASRDLLLAKLTEQLQEVTRQLQTILGAAEPAATP